jgi:hypothetical protein
MAGYLSPAAYLYVEEQEYLQAYEDVLERYKGTWATRAGVPAGPAGGVRDPASETPCPAGGGQEARCLPRVCKPWSCLPPRGRTPPSPWDFYSPALGLRGTGWAQP